MSTTQGVVGFAKVNTKGGASAHIQTRGEDSRTVTLLTSHNDIANGSSKTPKQSAGPAGANMKEYNHKEGAGSLRLPGAITTAHSRTPKNPESHGRNPLRLVTGQHTRQMENDSVMDQVSNSPATGTGLKHRMNGLLIYEDGAPKPHPAQDVDSFGQAAKRAQQ